MLCLLCSFGYGQVSSRQLSTAGIDSVFTKSFLNENGITFSIYKAFAYHDKTGDHFILMTEHAIAGTEDPLQNAETFYDSIKAYCFDQAGDSLVLKWTVSDFIATNEVSEEYSVWFWTNYFDLNDYDKDGIIDPIIVFGTRGMNGTDDGRIKILTFYKETKYGIRHQNCVMDSERNTKVDKAFYTLPATLQKRVGEIMSSIVANNHGIFPYGWEDAMKNKKVAFDEN